MFSKLIVSTESHKIKKLCEDYDINYINRPKYLSKSHIEKQEVIVHAVKNLKMINKNDIIISLQPNSPEVKISDIKKALNFFKK